MSSRMMQILLALSLLLNTFVLAGFVYRSWIAPPTFDHRFPPPPPPGPRPTPLEMVAHELDLDEAQRAKLRGVIDQYANTRRDRQRDIQKLRDQVAAEYRRPTIELARIDPIIEQLARLRVEQQKETLRTFAQLEPQLTPQQRERMHQILAERLAGPPPPPPPRPPGQGPGPGPRPGANGPGRPPPQ
ncbi:MAG: periplasmic heavy metal sensor [Reyranellaceae bacterium]